MSLILNWKSDQKDKVKQVLNPMQKFKYLNKDIDI